MPFGAGDRASAHGTAKRNAIRVRIPESNLLLKDHFGGERESHWMMGRGNNSSGIATRPRNSARSGQFCWPLPSLLHLLFSVKRWGLYISLTYTYPIPGRDSLRKSQLIMAKPPASQSQRIPFVVRHCDKSRDHPKDRPSPSHCTPRAVNFSAAHSGRREWCPVGRGIYVGESNRQRYGYSSGEW